MTTQTLLKSILSTGLIATAFSAQAHTGHGTESLMEGLVHPFGPDHLLAMVAVGVWSVSSLLAGKAWQGPAAFLLALMLSAVLGMLGASLPWLEQAIALSVVLCGLMLLGSGRRLPIPLGLGLIAATALLHGLAHGSETPESGFAGYAIGFLITTAALHLGGVGVGLAIQRFLAERRHIALGGLGTAFGAAGLYLFTQL